MGSKKNGDKLAALQAAITEGMESGPATPVDKDAFKKQMKIESG